MKPINIITVALSATLAIGASIACAQDYPTRPIRIVTSGIGGGNDFISRLIAQGISGPLGQQVIVDNQPSGIHPQMAAVKAPADGYTILVGGSAIWLSQFLRADVPYKVEDFAAVTTVDKSPLLVVVHPSLPVRSVKELIALAKAKPGALAYSTGSSGSTGHLSLELFKTMADVNMLRIPYKSGSQEILDLVSGEVPITFSSGAAAPHAKSGKLRAIAHTSDEPTTTLYPGLPSVGQSVPSYYAIGMSAMFVPAKTPAAIIKRLNEATVRVLRTPEAKERLFSNGTEPGGSTPEELAAKVKFESDRWGKVIKQLGITAN